MGVDEQKTNRIRAASNGEHLPELNRHPPLEIVSFADLRDTHSQLHPPVIDGLSREGETCNITADSKIGKSWLVYGLALSITTGRKWLDRFETRRGKVLLIDNELHPSTLAHRIPRVAEAMGIHISEYENELEVVSLRGRIRSLADLALDMEVIEPHTYQAIILDAKYRFVAIGQSENDNAAETLFYNKVDQIADKTRAALILIHHTSKGSQSDKKVTDVGSGAGAQSRAADCHLIMRPHEESGVVVVEAAVRSFKPVEPLAIRWEFPLWLPANGIDTTKLKGRQAYYVGATHVTTAGTDEVKKPPTYPLTSAVEQSALLDFNRGCQDAVNTVNWSQPWPELLHNLM